MALLLVASAAHAQLGPAQQELDNAPSNTRDWLYATHDHSGRRFVDLNQITPANARQLQAVCLWRATEAGPAQTNPLVYSGVMYLSVARSILAIDAKTCRQRWKYIWEPKGNELSPINRGGAIKDGKVTTSMMQPPEVFRSPI